MWCCDLGFSSSFLPEWVEEKTGGVIPAEAVERLDLAELDGPAEALQARLTSFGAQHVVAVDAERPEQLEALGEAVWRSERRLLFQSAASLINGLVPLPPQPLCMRWDGWASLNRWPRLWHG